MVASRYLDGPEPTANGSSRPNSRALRATRVQGTSTLAASPKLRAIDKSSDAYSLTYFDPPPGLERYILTLFEIRFHSSSIEGLHPAALGQLSLTLRGRIKVDFGEREDDVGGSPILFNAFDVATPYRADGSLWCLGASLSPYGWAALTQASRKEYGNRVIPASERLGPAVDRLNTLVSQKRLSDQWSAERACLEVANWIRERLSSIPAEHQAIIDRTLAWLGSSLNPPVEELFEGSTYSRRQTERLVQQYFGFPPRGLARKFRALRAANLLAQPNLTDEGEAEIACAFVDQPHMIREIRRFCGYTPSRLGGSGDAMFLRLTNMHNLDRFRPYRPIGKGDRTDGPPL